MKKKIMNLRVKIKNIIKIENVTSSLKDLMKAVDKGSDLFHLSFFVNNFRIAFPNFAQKVKTDYGEVYTQQDAEEFMSTLLTTLNEKIPKQNNSELLDLFRGKFEITLKNSEDSEEAQQTKYENFNKIDCHIDKGK
jgi:hypothetical protein